MFTGIANSWNLFKATWAVLQADKELLVFPIVSSIGVVLVSLAFAIPAFLTISSDNGAMQIVGYVLAFLFYLVTYFVIIFANSALVGAALIRLRGGDPTLSDGVRLATSHIGVIFGYALISATVGMILRWISERGTLAQIVSSVLGAGWNIATYLVVPILVTENVNPIDAIKRSIALLKQTWGEQLVGQTGIGWVMFLAVLVVILIGGGLFFLAASLNSPVLLVLVGIGVVLAIILLSLFSATLSGIYSAAVYRYAAEGQVGSQFPAGLVQNAFRAK